MNVLIVRMSSIGDVIHALPAAARLHAAGHRVGWLVEPLSAPLVLGNPAVAGTVVAPRRGRRFAGARDALRALRGERYDVALEVQGLWKSAVWARLSGARRVIGYAAPGRREPASALLLSERLAMRDGAAHVIDKNLALLGALDIEAVGAREFPLPSAPAAETAVAERLAASGWGELALLNPAGGWANKLWPAERFGELARHLRERGFTPVVTWGPGEEQLAERVVGASRGDAVRCFPTTLLELLALVRRARLVVAADTGPLHIACAAGVPVVGLYGPTDPARNGPFDDEDEVVRRAPPCAPCHKRRCPIHERVMQELPTSDVIAAVERRLARVAGARL